MPDYMWMILGGAVIVIGVLFIMFAIISGLVYRRTVKSIKKVQDDIDEDFRNPLRMFGSSGQKD